MARPRSQEAHRAALDAALEVLLESGVEGVTLEEVAARSGVARSTLYRHFGTREDLVVDAARTCVAELPTPDTGDLEEDLRQLFERFRTADEDGHTTCLLPMLVDAARRDPAMADVLHAFRESRRQPLRTVLRLAQLRGEIGEDLDIDAALSIVFGPFTYRRVVDGEEVTPEFVAMVLHASVAALRATARAGAR